MYVAGLVHFCSSLVLVDAHLSSHVFLVFSRLSGLIASSWSSRVFLVFPRLPLSSCVFPGLIASWFLGLPGLPWSSRVPGRGERVLQTLPVDVLGMCCRCDQAYDFVP